MSYHTCYNTFTTHRAVRVVLVDLQARVLSVRQSSNECDASSSKKNREEGCRNEIQAPVSGQPPGKILNGFFTPQGFALLETRRIAMIPRLAS